MSKFEIYSDGGGMKDSTSAGACIVRNLQTKEETKVVGFLGGATNNEAEIISGLIGFAIVKQMGGTFAHWVSDSEYTLKSATEYIFNWQKNGWRTASKSPVKNQGLWKAFLPLSSGIKIKPEHVAGHSGHPENEACDAICTWVRGSGAEALRTSLKIVSASSSSLDSNWQLIDLRHFLELAREESPAEDLTAILNDSIQGVSFGVFSESLAVSEDGLAETIEALKKAKKQAVKIKNDSVSTNEIAKAIQKVIDDLSKP